jgi:hypothetical protein
VIPAEVQLELMEESECESSEEEIIEKQQIHNQPEIIAKPQMVEMAIQCDPWVPPV